ncbi:MAG: restriction endonuclease, partial [Nitrosopumilus sp.]|nr:restriction endonuclease [Nitrosopumilus sp.]
MTQESNTITKALEILKALGLPRAQHNERSALTLLALLNITPGENWASADNPMIGITPIMEFAARKFGKEYAPNTR